MNSKTNIINHENIDSFRSILKNKKVGLCHGAFDILHFGHADHFKEAKKICDILLVSVTTDKFIKKGPLQPFFNIQQRVKFLLSIRYVDYVYISNSLTGEEAINLFKPNFYIKGIDYLNQKNDKNLIKEKKICKKNSTKLFFTKTNKHSSTKILNNHFHENSKETDELLKKINNKYSIKQISKIIEKIENKKIILTGEPILDIYKYIDVIGTATKSPIITSDFISEEIHAGGTIAAGNMMTKFSKKIFYLIPIEKKNVNSKISSKINNNMNIIPFNIKFQTPIKTRFVTKVRNNKIFQVNNLKEFNTKTKLYKNYIKKIQSYLKNYPVFLLDFGLGLITKETSERYIKGKNLYLNVQSNSNNYGFNLFDKYKNFSYLSINLREFELSFKKKIISYNEIKNLIVKKKLSPMSVTLGHKGSLFINKKNKLFYCPNFYENPVDTTGCGDAYFIMTSFLISLGIDDELVPFIGNIYAGLHSKNFGNSKFPDKKDLLKSIESILNI
jgi:cytidyltransferase-like protein